MNLILLDQTEIKNGKATIEGRRAEHIRKVIKPAPGDILKAGIINGPVGRGRITACGRAVTLELDDLADPPRGPETILIAALPRPIMLRRVLAQAAAFGVRELHLINSARVEKSFFSASLVKKAAWQEFLIKGLEQGGRTRLPKVLVHNRFRPFIEDFFPDHFATHKRRFIAHPCDNPRATNGDNREAVAAIGPEGGWVDFEIEKFLEQSFTPISLGSTIMRVDWAIPALLSILETTSNLLTGPGAP